MKNIIFYFIFLLSFQTSKCQDISLYNKSGEAIAYISLPDDYAVYSWQGKPLGYLYEENSLVHFYTFSGKHLGWFENGLIRDHNGDVIIFVKNALRYINYEIEDLKSLKEQIPLRNVRELAPLKPLNSLKFSNSPFTFIDNSDNTKGSNKVFANRPNLISVEPYIVNTNAILNSFQSALLNLTKRQEIIKAYEEAGYVYDSQSQSWITMDVKKDLDSERARELKEKRAQVSNAWNLYNSVKNSLPPLKAGKHKAFLVNDYNYLTVDVLVGSNLKVKNIDGVFKDLKYKKNNKITNRLAKVQFNRVVYDTGPQKYIQSAEATLLFVFE